MDQSVYLTKIIFFSKHVKKKYKSAILLEKNYKFAARKKTRKIYCYG